MDWRQLQRELKAGKTSNLYVVYGEDTWQVDRSRSFLAALIPPSEQEYNLVQIDGARIELSELEMHLQLSLLGERKLLMIENFHLLKPRGKVEEEMVENEQEAILRNGPKEEAVWLDRLVHSDHIIVLYGYHALDARRRFTKQVLVSAAVVECPMLRGDGITRAVRDFFLTRNLRADFNLVSYIGQLAGSQLGIAEQEIEKLALVFSAEKPIQLKEAMPYLSPSAELNVFELMDLLTTHKPDQALALTSELLRRGEEPLRLLGLMRYQLRQLVRVHQGKAQALSDRALMEWMGMKEYPFRRTVSQARAFQKNDLYELLQFLVSTEEGMLQGTIDKTLALELLIASIGVMTRPLEKNK